MNNSRYRERELTQLVRAAGGQIKDPSRRRAVNTGLAAVVATAINRDGLTPKAHAQLQSQITPAGLDSLIQALTAASGPNKLQLAVAEASARAMGWSVVSPSGGDDTGRVIDAFATGKPVMFAEGIFSVAGRIAVASRSRVWAANPGHTRINGKHAGLIFDVTGTERTEISHIAISGPGCTAIGATTFNKYASTLDIHHVDFYADLRECIYANLILCDIHHNVFGFYGTAGAAHRHIYTMGNQSTLTTNENTIRKNRMYFAVGSESIFAGYGLSISLTDNNLEHNSARALNLQGMQKSLIEGNWFEQNNTTVESQIASAFRVNPRITVWRGNFFNVHAKTACLVSLSGTWSPIRFDDNETVGIAGKAVTYSKNGKDAAADYLTKTGNYFL